MSGQNDRAAPVVVQYIDGDTKIVWPLPLQTVDPVLPLPKSSVYAK
jgi:branched-chain amino acid transport system substrate-binding protein